MVAAPVEPPPYTILPEPGPVGVETPLPQLPPWMFIVSVPPAPPLKVRPPAGTKLQPAKSSDSVSLPPRPSKVMLPVTDANGTLTVLAFICTAGRAPAPIVFVGS